MNDVTIGDVLTDNAYGQDGYRYHDAFHLAYCAVLGWSPVIRSLMRRKRKSDPEIDEVEDGGRARVVEEAVANYLFSRRNKENGYAEPNSIGFGVVQTVQSLVSNLEVKDATVKQWQQAICEGFKIFGALVENRGGIVSVDMDKAEITYVQDN